MSEAVIEVSPYQSGSEVGSAGFAKLLRAEWTKFRTVRGWLVGMILAAVVTVGIAAVDHSSCGGLVTPGGAVTTGQGCSSPVGPGGEAVTDSPYFLQQPLGARGSITVRVTSLTGRSADPGPAGAIEARLQPWSKAGIMIKASDRPGSAYAAMMVTAGHGVRMQYDFTGDVAGQPGPVAAASPRWLRLTRSGETVTGYESGDGTRWHVVGTVRLAGLPANALAGLFAAAPAGSESATSSSISGSSGNSGMNLATARFDHVSLRGGRPGQAWIGTEVGGRAGAPAGTGFRQAGRTFTVTGSGDVAPDVPAAPDGGGGFPIEHTLLGIFGALVAVIVVAAMFMTAEYRRGLIRVTLAASPRRGRVLAAKVVVIGSVSFLAGLAGSTAALWVGEHLLRSRGDFIMPVSMLTELRVLAGNGRADRSRCRPRARGRGPAPEQRRGRHFRDYGSCPALPAREHGLASRSGGLGAANHARGRLRDPAEPAAVSAGSSELHARERLLPARAVGWLRRAVRLRRACPGACRHRAPPKGRMSSTGSSRDCNCRGFGFQPPIRSAMSTMRRYATS